MRYARIDGGVAVEFVETDGDIAKMFHPSLQFVAASAEAALGWVLDGDELVAPPPPPPVLPPVPASISDRKFFQQLAIEGEITKAEALAAVGTGTIPAALETIVETMPADQQFSARMLLSGATIFERSHPMTEYIRVAYGWTAAQVDDFFRAAALL